MHPRLIHELIRSLNSAPNFSFCKQKTLCSAVGRFPFPQSQSVIFRAGAIDSTGAGAWDGLLGMGPEMRVFLLSLISALCLFSSEGAEALIVTNGQSVEIYGPFNPDPFGIDHDVIVNAYIEVNTNYPYYQYHYPIQAGFHATASITNGLSTMSSCASNNPGPCEPYNPHTIADITAASPIIYVETSFQPFYYDPNNSTHPDTTEFGQVFVDLEISNLDFTIGVVGAVPEPSTWAMLLIGFAAMGVAGYRRSRRDIFI
jgi:hypothetical protein